VTKTIGPKCQSTLKVELGMTPPIIAGFAMTAFDWNC